MANKGGGLCSESENAGTAGEKGNLIGTAKAYIEKETKSAWMESGKRGPKKRERAEYVPKKKGEEKRKGLKVRWKGVLLIGA